MAKVKIGVETKGFDQLVKTLNEVSDSMFRKYARAGVAAVAKKQKQIQRRDVARNKTMPAQNGKQGRKKLYQSIKVVPSSKWRGSSGMAKRGLVGASVGPQWPEGAHANLIEFGFMQQWTLVEDDLNAGQFVLIKNKTPRRIAPQPFVRPSHDQMKGHHVSIFANEVKKRLEKDLAKKATVKK